MRQDFFGKLLCATALCLAFAACSGPMDESVFTRLSPDDVAKMEAKVPDFYYFYEKTQAMARQAGQFEMFYRQITYKQLYNYQKDYYDNSLFEEQCRQKARTEFLKEYDRRYRNAVEQEKRKWGEYVRNNDPAQYLRIEAVTGILERGSASYPQFYFNVSEPKGAVSSADIFYDAVKKGAKTSEDWGEASLAEIKACNSLRTAWHFSDFDDARFWDNHTMLIEVRKVVMEDGRIFSLAELSHVPASVRLYYQNPGPETEAGIIRELINPNFLSQEEAVEQRYQDLLKEKDPLCYEFIKNYGNVF